MGWKNEHHRNCAGMGHGMHAGPGVSAVRICSNDCNNWIDVLNPPDLFHDFWLCGSAVHGVKVKTAGGGTIFTRKAGNHDCGAGSEPKSSINQIAGSTNYQTCFEMNGRGGDSNHHWALWHGCNGAYVNSGTSPESRTGWARVMIK